MPVREIQLSEELDQFISAEVKSGRYKSANDVVEEGLLFLKEHEEGDDEKLHALREAVEAGFASGVAEDGVFDRLRSRFDLEKAE